jgi:hypothetical protein
MDTPPGLRGSNYPTHLSARCPSFHACSMCGACTKYSHDILECINCEKRKSYDTICNHTDDQQYTIVYLTKMFRAPIFHPDDRPKEVSIPVAYNEDWEKIASGLDPTGLGKITPIQEK